MLHINRHVGLFRKSRLGMQGLLIGQALIISISSLTAIGQVSELSSDALRGGSGVGFASIDSTALSINFETGLSGLTFDTEVCQLNMALSQPSGCIPDPDVLSGCDTLLELDGQYYQLSGNLDFTAGINLIAQGPAVTNCRLSNGNPLPPASGAMLTLGSDEISIVSTSVALEQVFDGTIVHVRSQGNNVICDGATSAPVPDSELVFRTSFERGLADPMFAVDDRRFGFSNGLTASLNAESGIDINTPDIPVLDCNNPTQQPVSNISTSSPTLMSGQSAVISWSASNAVACTTLSGGSTAWSSRRLLPPSGTETIQITGDPLETFTFALRCVNQEGLENNCLAGVCGTTNVDTVQTSVQIVGSGTSNCPDPTRPDCFPPPPAFCGAEPPGRRVPFNIFRNLVNTTARNYNDTWNQDPWPSSGDVIDLLIPNNSYLALPFVAQPNLAVWRMNWVDRPSSGSAVNASLSRCPGDFTNSLGDNCVVTTSPNGAITAIVGTSTLACNLVEGETYYWNVRNTDANGNDACSFSTCTLVARPTRLQRRSLQ